MKKVRRIANLAFVLSLALLLTMQPYSAAAQAPGGEHRHDETCGYAEASPCLHEHDEGCGYTEGTPELPCNMECEGGSHAEGCAYAPAAPEVPCAHLHDEGCGYAEAVPCTFMPEGAGVADIGIEASLDALDYDPPLSILSEGVAYSGQVETGTYTISTAAQLAQLAQAVDNGTSYSGSTFLLTADIDLSISDSYESLTWSGSNWEPIGSSEYRFSGTFDGQDHKITNLTIDTDQYVVGLFSRTRNAVIKNLGLERVDIKSSGDDIGGLIGNDYEGSQISRCYVIGKVQARAGFGGLLGSTHGNGSSRSSTRVANCFARVELTGPDGVDSTADNSGISGWNNPNGIVITNCYSASTGEKRPIAGWSDGGAITASNFVSAYYDASLSPNLTDNTSLGRTTLELQTQSTFVNWDFTDVWAIDPQQNGGYPYLKNMAPDLNGAPGFYSTGLGGATQSAVTNGTVQVQPGYSQQGNTVTITLTPDAGYEVDTISAYKEGDTSTPVDLTSSTTNVYTYTMPAYDVSVAVTYKAATYSISYNGLEGAANSNPATYTFGAGIPSLADPGSRTGFTFTGWYDAESGGNKVDSISTTAMGNVSLWAWWTPLPSLTATPAGLSFGNQVVNTTGTAQTVMVSGANLTGTVTYEVTGADASAFTVTEKSWTSSAGGTLDVTFTPTQARAYSASLTIKSTGATGQAVSLSGTGIAATVPAITANLPLQVELGAGVIHYNITVTASNATGGYQWYRADGTPIGSVVDAGAATSSLDVGALGAGQYYVVVYGDGGKTVQSNTCTVTIGTSAGTVIVDIKPGHGIPGVSIPDVGALKNAALNDAEKADVRDNNVTYTVTLSVAAASPNANTTAAEQKASNGGYTVAAHYDITVDIYRDAVHVRNVTSLSNAVNLVMEIPTELQQSGRAFAMIRVHNGTATVLADKDNSGSTITFASDSFSVYTMVYKDGTDGGGSSGGTTGSSGSTTGSTGTGAGGSPQTGDDSNMGLWVALLVASLVVLGAGVVLFIRQRRRRVE